MLNDNADGNDLYDAKQAKYLAPVQGSVSLSTRNSAVFFDLTRIGRVTVFEEAPCEVEPGKELCQLETDGKGWRWEQGWLPILHIRERYELFASGDELFLRDENSYFIYPNRRQVPEQEFATAKQKEIRYWRKWFSEGLELPGLPSRLDQAWRSSLIQALTAFVGRHPCYGALYYRHFFHDAFPPNVLTMTEALLQFHHGKEAAEILLYYLQRFVRADGTIDYYGPSLAEYGGLMSLASMVIAEVPEYSEEIVHEIRKLIHQVLSWFNFFLPGQIHSHEDSDFLLHGSPEADERDQPREYFHNNCQILRGLTMLAPEIRKKSLPELGWEMEKFAGMLRKNLIRVFIRQKNQLGGIPYYVGQTELPENIQADTGMMYANYRYYPELLETGYLSKEDALRYVEYREKHHGEYLGMTLFTPFRDNRYVSEVDNWPMGAYARAMLEYGERERFMRILTAQFCNYISPDIFTAYEQVHNEGTPRTAAWPSCVPVQLLLPRMLAWSFFYRKWNGEIVKWGGPSLLELKTMGLYEDWGKL